MNVLNILSTGGIGGIEVLCKDIGLNADYDNGFCFLFAGGVIFDQMRSTGMEVMSLAESRKFSIAKTRTLRDIVRSYDIVIIHHSDPYLQMYYLYLKRIYPHKKFVMTVHSCFEKSIYYDKYSFGKRIFRKWLLERSIAISDKMIFVSNAGAKSYRDEFNFSLEKAKVVYNGIGTEKLVAGKDVVHKIGDKIKLLYIGRLIDVKGVHLLIKAVSLISKMYTLELTIVGDGEEREGLEALSTQLNLNTNITFVGAQSNVVPFLKSADIFVYPSTCKEIFGISIVEAMAFGLICIANNVGGIPEIVQDAKNGYLTRSSDPEGLAMTIELAIRDLYSGTSKLIIAAAKHTAEEFSIMNTVTNLEKIYSELLD